MQVQLLVRVPTLLRSSQRLHPLQVSLTDGRRQLTMVQPVSRLAVVLSCQPQHVGGPRRETWTGGQVFIKG